MANVPANAAALLANHDSPSADRCSGSHLPDAWRFLVATVIVAADATDALAGMPALTFTDIAAQRLEVISFFFMGFLACAWIIQRLWNSAAPQLANLPRLTYPRAVGLTLIWGFLFLLVLTMISGARELMTPGAWQKRGVTYKLADAPDEKSQANTVYAARLEKLAALRDALWVYAKTHEGKLPDDIDSAGLSEDLWRVPDASGMRYLYFGGTVIKDDPRVVVLEPSIFHDRQLAITAAGLVGKIGDFDLTQHPRRSD